MTVAVVGAGAVGCYFGGMLAYGGANVVLIGREAHMDAITRAGLRIDSINGTVTVSLRATTELSAARGADVVLFCVKAGDTDATARALAQYCTSDTTIVSMQNGVDNAVRIRSVTGARTIPAVVYVAAEMSSPGVVRHSGRGDLIIGSDHPAVGSESLHTVAALFKEAAVPCRISDDINAELWSKLAINCAYNAISALTRSRYGAIAADADALDLMRRVVNEVVDVAHASEIRMDRDAIIAGTLRLADAMPGAMSSTAQDLERGRATEIAALNGYIAAAGERIGIDTPYNTTLFRLVKLLEKAG